jgi:hypothetical protein
MATARILYMAFDLTAIANEPMNLGKWNFDITKLLFMCQQLQT